MIQTATDYLQGKIPNTVLFILIEFVLIAALWSKFDDFETRVRELEDFKLTIEVVNKYEHEADR